MSYVNDISLRLNGMFTGDSWGMSNALVDLFKLFPGLFEDMYNINHDIIKSLKTKWELKDQGKQLIHYLDGTKFPYEKDFEAYYQFHTLNGSSVYQSQKWEKFQQHCIETYPDHFKDNKDGAYMAKDVVYTTYGVWRAVRANLDTKSKRVLLNILTDYNNLNKAEEENEGEGESENEKKKKKKGSALSDFFY